MKKEDEAAAETLEESRGSRPGNLSKVKEQQEEGGWNLKG